MFPGPRPQHPVADQASGSTGRKPGPEISRPASTSPTDRQPNNSLPASSGRQAFASSWTNRRIQEVLPSAARAGFEKRRGRARISPALSRVFYLEGGDLGIAAKKD